MTFCRGSPPKHRASKPHGPHSRGRGKNDYARGMRGHSWRRMYATTVDGKSLHIGRICNRCNDIVLI